MKLYILKMADGGEWHIKQEDREALSRWLSAGPSIWSPRGGTLRIAVDQIVNISEHEVPPDDTSSDNFTQYVPARE